MADKDDAALETVRPGERGGSAGRHDLSSDQGPVDPPASTLEPARFRHHLVGLLLVGFIGIAVPLAIIFIDVDARPTTHAAVVPALVAGTCVDGSLAVVACDVSHFGEVIFVGFADADALFPTVTDPVRDWADQRCGTAFLNYLGRAPAASRYELRVNFPSALQWAQGDRRIICLATNPDQSPLTRSVKGSAH